MYLLCGAFVVSAQTPGLVEDIQPGGGSSNPKCFINYNGKLHFIAGTTSSTSATMWGWENFGIPASMIDGGTGTLANPSNTSNVGVVFNGKLYYRGGPSSSNPDKIMVYDGVNPPVLAPGAGGWKGVNFSDPVVLGSKVYFLGDTVALTSGASLFSYDGINAPVFIKYISSAARTNSTLSHLIAFKGKLYFSCVDLIGGGLEPFSYDPATNAVSRVADINPGAPGNNGSGPCHFIVGGTKLYFAASDSLKGLHIFSYDGSNLKKLTFSAGGPAKSVSGNNMEFYKGALFFKGAITGTTRDALFKYDTATRVVTLVKDVNPAADPAISYLFATPHNLYFFGRTNAAGLELWRYDGKDCKMLADLNPGTAHGVSAVGFAMYEGHVFFTGHDGKTGYELYRVMDLPAPSGIQRAGWHGEVTAYPNPATAAFTLAITLLRPQALRVSLTDIRGREIFISEMSAIAGRNELKLPMADFAGGQYFYHLQDNEGHALVSGSLLKQ